MMWCSASSPLRFPPELICAIHSTDKRQIAAALAESGIGAGVLPYHGIRGDGSCTCGDFNCPNAGKHPNTKFAPHGVRSATRDARRAWEWFNLCPDHNLALALGRDLAAGDWDPQHGANLTEKCGLPTNTMTARSGGGGLHRLMRIRPHWELKSGYIATGVELRTGHQAIVIERSRHRSGGSYEWNNLLAPIRMLPKKTVDHINATRSSLITVDPLALPQEEFRDQWQEINQVRYALLRGKYRSQARLLLDGKWEAAGHASQSEGEFNLILLISDVTEDRTLWLAILRSSGLGKRDRECTRRPDGHGHKLARPDYTASVLARVAARRAELRHTGDPNLVPARAVFLPIIDHPQPHSHSPQTPDPPGDVIDANKKRRGRPRGGAKRQSARAALIRFLASAGAVRDRQDYIRVPMGEAAKMMDISRETIRKALNDLLSHDIVEGPAPSAYWKNGNFAKDRCLRLTVSEADALAQIEEME